MAYKITLIILFLLGGIYAFALQHPVRADMETKKQLIELSKQVKAEDRRLDALRRHSAQVARVKEILVEANSPMAEEAESFVTCGKQYGVSYKLLLGLSWKESSYGKHTPHYGRPSNNAFGITGSGIPGERFRTFSSFSDGICATAKLLSENYEHTNIRKVIFKYAPPVENDSERYVTQLEEYIKNI